MPRTNGEWAVIAYSVFNISYSIIKGPLSILTLIAPVIFSYLTYRIITKLHPKSQNWGFFLWVGAIFGAVLLYYIVIMTIAAGFVIRRMIGL